MAGGGIKVNYNTIRGGADGATYIPQYTDGYLVWTNNKNLPNPPAMYVKGETGEKGADGINGLNGTDGKDGKDGKDGTILVGNPEGEAVAELTKIQIGGVIFSLPSSCSSFSEEANDAGGITAIIT